MSPFLVEDGRILYHSVEDATLRRLRFFVPVGLPATVASSVRSSGSVISSRENAGLEEKIGHMASRAWSRGEEP